MSTPLPPIRFVVDRLLPEGLHILAGAPKAGKSWLALWLCLQVAKGEPVWEHPSRRGTVLYLCLEDTYARIQSRLFQLTEDAPGTLHFCNLSGSIGCGLEEQLKSFLATHPDTVLVVIDTLQRVRAPGDSGALYASDYRDLTALKQIADCYGIALLLIHHLRKLHDGNPFHMISGTAGISGAADSSFVLLRDRRGGKGATLYCTGRDIEYRELPLIFRNDTHTWEPAEPVPSDAEPTDPTLALLIQFLSQLRQFDGTATELSGLLQGQTGERMLPSVLSKKLIRYAGPLEQAGIRITSERTRDTRLLHLLYFGGDSSDGNDGKSDTGPVPNLLSQPSLPSLAGFEPTCGGVSAFQQAGGNLPETTGWAESGQCVASA